MFCFQCEQTAGCKACTGSIGVCGKTADVANLQDELTGVLIGLAQSEPIKCDSLNRKVIVGLFTTMTNVNFDAASIRATIDDLKQAAEGYAAYDMQGIWGATDDIRCLKSLILFGIRGISAYAYHAMLLGKKNNDVCEFIFRALKLIGNNNATQDELLAAVLETGKINLICLEVLDAANTGAYGQPRPTEVTQTIEPGPFIVVSGHDLHDLKLLLEQTDGRGVNVYTHGEMLPAHAYPELKKYAHLKGNFGTAWQNQQKEFADVPAAFLFTTNCLMPPKPNYAKNVFTTAVVGYPGLVHIGEKFHFAAGAAGAAGSAAAAGAVGASGAAGSAGSGGDAGDGGVAGAVGASGAAGAAGAEAMTDNNKIVEKDFSPVIECALALGGYRERQTIQGINGGSSATTGFGHDAVLSNAGAILEAVKSGDIRHFFLVGGCDGAKPGRNYFTDFVRLTPDDTVILTLACGKYRFNDLNLGNIGDLPRLLDMGQCNDAYSAIKVGLALAEAFNCEVNDLPLTFVLSWYEQKAVSILLTLLYLGVKNIKLGPTLPAFVSKNILNFLVENFGIAPVTDAKSDLLEILGGI